MNKKYVTDFLFPENSFITGMGSLLNISGNYFIYNYSDDGAEADWKALKSDWGTIGQDFDSVINKTSPDKLEYTSENER
jgi:hypothetical protein